MIPFASQRGLGQDLATHLQNEFDNEYVEVAELRGAVAQDLHGAFKEWEILARVLTRCQNYLYSLSVNPDPAQGELTRGQYFDYIARTERALGLTGQPRAIVFHVKPDKHGHAREHCHVIWSRIEAQQGRAIPLAFDHDRLMAVTQEFARDHGLTLPDGYHKDGGRHKTDQLSLYELHQQCTTGLTREQRMEQVTAIWRASDSPKAFVQALADHGYILTTGKRPYILVDIYGHMNALPKLIDDKTVRLKNIRAFLEKEFPPAGLPTVEEAKALAARHCQAFETNREHEQMAEAVAQLKKAQATRRQETKQQQKVQRLRQHQERQALADRHRAARDAQRAAYLAQLGMIRRERRRHHRHGLSVLFNRASGIEWVRKKLRRLRDRRRYRAYIDRRNKLREQQARALRDLAERHKLQALDLQRQIRALNQINKRERQSLEESLRAEQRIADRGGGDRMPPIRTVAGDRVSTGEAAHRHHEWLTGQFEQALARRIKPIDLEDAFTRAAEGEQESGDNGESSDGPYPRAESEPERPRRRRGRDQYN